MRHAGPPATAKTLLKRAQPQLAGRGSLRNVPAYVIVHDATLRAIAPDPPRDLDALAAIGGVGAGTLERYGREVIATLDAAD